MPNIGTTELIVIVGIGVLLFGAQRLPDAARGLGKTFNAFKEGLKTITDDKNA